MEGRIALATVSVLVSQLQTGQVMPEETCLDGYDLSTFLDNAYRKAYCKDQEKPEGIMAAMLQKMKLNKDEGEERPEDLDQFW